MNDTMIDEQLLAQPIGYWSWAAATSVRDHIRGHLATVGVTQAQWWCSTSSAIPTACTRATT